MTAPGECVRSPDLADALAVVAARANQAAALMNHLTGLLTAQRHADPEAPAGHPDARISGQRAPLAAVDAAMTAEGLLPDIRTPAFSTASSEAT